MNRVMIFYLFLLSNLSCYEGLGDPWASGDPWACGDAVT